MSKQIIPRQKLSRSQKGEKWGKAMMDELEKLVNLTTGSNRSSSYRKQVNYDLYNGFLNKDDLEYVLDPYGFGKGEFPANLQHYDIISPKLNLLFGEEIKRPFNYSVVAVNDEAISELQEEKRKMFMNIFSTMIEEEMEAQRQKQQTAEQQMGNRASETGQPQQQPQGQQQEKPTLPKNLQELEKYMAEDYKSMREMAASMAMTYLVHKEKLPLKFNEMWKDVLIGGEEIGYVGSRGGDPTLRVCNPKDITVVSDPDSPWIEDSIAVIEGRWLNVATILDEFYEELTPKQIDRLEQHLGRGLPSNGDVAYQEANFIIKDETAYQNSQKEFNSHDGLGNIRVIHAEWRSMRKIGVITIDGEEDIVGEEFKIPDEAIKNEDGAFEWEQEEMLVTLKWYWITEVWEGTKIWDDIYVDIQPKANQRRSMDNPSRCKLGYIGYIYNNRNSESVSLVDRMKPYQYLYNIIYYRTELAFAKNKGRLMLMDLAQIPSSMGWDVDKWLYYAEAMNIAFINSAEEQPNGQKASFNNWTSIDLSMGAFINQHVMMLDKIEDKIGELSGVTAQRQGQIQTSSLVGTAERSVVQSSHITEPWFYSHNEVKKRVLTALLEVAQVVWKKGKKINHLFDDMTRIVFEIEPDTFAMSEYSVFVSDSSKEMKIKTTLEQMAMNGYQSGVATAVEAITMLEYDSISKIKRDLKQLDIKKQELAAAQTKAETDASQQEFQQEADLKLTLDDRETDRNREDNETDRYIADLSADVKLEIADKQNNPEDVANEREKIAIQRDKILQDVGLKRKQLSDQKAAKAQELRLKEKDLEIKKKNMNKPSTQ